MRRPIPAPRARTIPSLAAVASAFAVAMLTRESSAVVAPRVADAAPEASASPSSEKWFDDESVDASTDDDDESVDASAHDDDAEVEDADDGGSDAIEGPPEVHLGGVPVHHYRVHGSGCGCGSEGSDEPSMAMLAAVAVAAALCRRRRD